MKPAPWDALKHHPQYGYPEQPPEQQAEIIQRDRERWDRSSKRLVQRPASSPFRDPRKQLRMR